MVSPVETLVLEGERYRGKFSGEKQSRRQMRKTGGGYIDYDVLCDWWEGTAVIKDSVTGRERHVKFSTEGLDGPEDMPYGAKDVHPKYPFEYGIMHVHDQYTRGVEPELVVDREKVIDLALAKIMEEADNPRYGNGQLSFRPFVKIKPLEMDELVSRGYAADKDGKVRLLTET